MFGGAGAGAAAGLVNAGRGAETCSGGGGGASLGCGGCTGGCGAAAKGASVAVNTNSVLAGGAGVPPRDTPSNTSACSAIEASTHQNKARSSVNGRMSPAVTAEEDMGQE